MKRLQIITICLLAAFAAAADTNTTEELEHLRFHVEQEKALYKEALQSYRKLLAQYNEACLKAGITNSRPKAASSSATIFTKSQRRFFENRRYCVSRDTATIPGSVITTWYRNGKLDTKAPAVVTNVLKNVAGVVQNNPLQARLEELGEQYRAAVQRYTSAEARAARADALKAWLIEQRDKAALPTTKAIYQAIIDRLEGE